MIGNLNGSKEKRQNIQTEKEESDKSGSSLISNRSCQCKYLKKDKKCKA